MPDRGCDLGMCDGSHTRKTFVDHIRGDMEQCYVSRMTLRRRWRRDYCSSLLQRQRRRGGCFRADRVSAWGMVPVSIPGSTFAPFSRRECHPTSEFHQLTSCTGHLGVYWLEMQKQRRTSHFQCSKLIVNQVLLYGLWKVPHWLLRSVRHTQGRIITNLNVLIVSASWSDQTGSP